ncbi:MAG: M12 family metallo-peptidase [archaeon]
MVKLFSKFKETFRKDWAKTSLAYKTFLLSLGLMGNYLLWGMQYTQAIEKYDETIYVYTDKKYMQKYNLTNLSNYEWTREECDANAHLIPPDFKEDVATLEQELKKLYPIDVEGEKVTLDIVLDDSISWLTEDERDEMNKGKTTIPSEKKPYWHNQIINSIEALNIYKNYGIEFAVNSVTIIDGNVCGFLADQENGYLFSNDVHDYIEQRNDYGADINIFLMNYPLDHGFTYGHYCLGEVNEIGGDAFIADIGHETKITRNVIAHEMGHLFKMVHPASHYNYPGTHAHDYRSNQFFRIVIDPFFLLGVPANSHDLCNGELMQNYVAKIEDPSICPKNEKRLLKNKSKFKD